jgi:hypothetical protein
MIGNDAKDTDELLSALKAMAKWARDGDSDRKGLRPEIPKLHMLSAEQVLTPAEAFYADSKRVALNDAAGQIAAEMLRRILQASRVLIQASESPTSRCSTSGSAWNWERSLLMLAT